MTYKHLVKEEVELEEDEFESIEDYVNHVTEAATKQDKVLPSLVQQASFVFRGIDVDKSIDEFLEEKINTLLDNYNDIMKKQREAPLYDHRNEMIFSTDRTNSLFAQREAYRRVLKNMQEDVGFTEKLMKTIPYRIKN